MKKTAAKLILYLLSAFCAAYILMVMFLPSKINVIEGEKTKINTYLPVSISANAQTNGEIEYDFSSSSVSGNSQGSYKALLYVAGIPVKEVSINVLPDTLLIPSGSVKGIVLDYDGMLVLGTGKVETKNSTLSPSKGLLKTGDIIESIDGKKPASRQEVSQMVQDSGGNEMEIIVKRNNEEKTVKVTPAFSAADGQYKLGCWIRSETQGLGTITFVDKNSGKFGALGHGVYDADAKNLLEIKDGIITKAIISGIKKSEAGIPGEISGALDKTEVLGNIEKNTKCGIYGKLEDISEFEHEEIPVALSSSITEGKAYILSDAIDEKITEYEIEIESKSGFGREDDKSMIICIKDERLIEKTGGIVQGMSGSPIMQNGKIVGAVTHVFVNDPLRGYGVFIENMISEAS